jgi:hypothetical protein
MKLWEIRKRREHIEKYEARDHLHNIRVVNAGFNGGDGAESLQKELYQKAFPKPVTILSKREKPRNRLLSFIDSLRNL